MKQGFLSTVEVSLKTKKAENNKMTHPADIQGQSSSSGCLAEFVTALLVGEKVMYFVKIHYLEA